MLLIEGGIEGNMTQSTIVLSQKEKRIHLILGISVIALLITSVVITVYMTLSPYRKAVVAKTGTYTLVQDDTTITLFYNRTKDIVGRQTYSVNSRPYVVVTYGDYRVINWRAYPTQETELVYLPDNVSLNEGDVICFNKNTHELVYESAENVHAYKADAIQVSKLFCTIMFLIFCSGISIRKAYKCV